MAMYYTRELSTTINLYMKYIISYLFFLMILNSCLSVQFDNPQPKGKKGLKESVINWGGSDLLRRPG